MRTIKKTIEAIVIFTAILLWANTAYAYIDPGSGSMIFQFIIAGLLGALVVIKRFWMNIKKFLRNIFSRNSIKQTYED